MHEIFDTIFEVSSFPRFQYLELSASFASPGERHHYWTLLYPDKGEIAVTADGVDYLLKEGNAILCLPGQEVAFCIRDKLAANLYLIGFTLEKGTVDAYAGKIFPVSAELRARVKCILKEAKFAYQNDLRDVSYTKLVPSQGRPIGTEQMMKLLMEQFLIYMVRETQINQERSHQEIVRENLLMNNLGFNPYFDKLIHYLEENIAKQLTLEDICRDNLTNRSKVQKAFRDATTEGVISFHQKLKIEYAKLMIRESSLNFTQIAEALGFSSVHHFSKKFKQLVKMSPSEYLRFSK